MRGTSQRGIEWNISENVRRIREHSGMSQGELCRQLQAAGLDNFHPTTLSRIEKGERPLRFAEAVTFSKVLGIPPLRLTAPPDLFDVVADLDGAFEEVTEASIDLSLAVDRYEDARLNLRRAADRVEASGVVADIGAAQNSIERDLARARLNQEEDVHSVIALIEENWRRAEKEAAERGKH